VTVGTLEDLTHVRVYSIHEDWIGHEHDSTAGGVDDITFPGIEELLVEFWASPDEYWEAVGSDPSRPY
jgi:hypothetical protein